MYLYIYILVESPSLGIIHHFFIVAMNQPTSGNPFPCEHLALISLQLGSSLGGKLRRQPMLGGWECR